ncbi:MAG: hypothetical protein KAR42_07160 [candidate division Zixibacteria bacterium]|nr:hypothetical protein [candidate division Zixibacteria bacterium]
MKRKVTFMGKSSETEPNDFNTESKFRFDINLFELASQVLKRRRLVIGTSFAITVIVAVLLFMQPNRFTSTATILPSGKSTGNMSALKSLVGLSGPMLSADENSSVLFPVILQSNLIAEQILDRTYNFTHHSQSRELSLKEYLEQTDRDKLRKGLRSITTIRANQKTGEIALGIETEFPGFSQAILTEYIERLEDFNLNKRKSSARNNEMYLARQIKTSAAELEMAEDALESYQLANLDWANSGSPEIMKELGRLRRIAEAKSSTDLMLQQQYTMAKLDAQKDVPIVRILDSPSLPTQKSGPFRRNIILMAGVLSFGFMAFLVMLFEIIKTGILGKNKDDLDDFTGQLRESFPLTDKLYEKIKSRQTKSVITP